MYKRALYLLLSLIMVPTLATAQTYWAINATTSPAALKTNLTASRAGGINFGNYTTPGGAAKTLTNVIRTPYTSVNFDVAAAPDGYKLLSVKVDGVVKGSTPGTYTVLKGTMLNHTIVATYSAAVANYTLTSQAAAGGTISPSTTYNSNGTVTVTPAVGYNLSGLIIGGITYALTDTLPAGVTLSGSASGATYTFASGSYTVKGVFTAVPIAKAIISTPSMTLPMGSSGIFLDGSASIGDSFAWSTTCGTFNPTSPTGKTATYDAQAIVGACTVTLTVTTAGVTPSPTATVTITTNNPVVDATNSCLACHNGTGGPAVTGFVAGEPHFCQKCHNPNTDLTHSYAPLAEVRVVCADCHNSGAQTVNFINSKHWNNHLEYGPEFTGGAVEGQLNANESWTTYENGALVTCAYRCHFKPGMGPDPTRRSTGGIAYVDPQTGQTYNRPTGDKCLACHDSHKPQATYKDTCLTCHSGSKHGKVPNEFFGSKHWQNNLEIGPEFANQINTTVVGGSVVANGTVDGVMNANDSYTTTENGGATTCAYRCHFRPGMGPEQNVGTVLANGKSTGYITYTDTTGKYGAAGTVYSRPGGNACMACHDPHGLAATAQSTCYTCHAGGNHGWSVAAFEKSTHFTGTYAKLDGMDKESCSACHNAHSTEATFGAYSSLTPVAATGCQTCHTAGSPYGIYNADQSGKAPHFQTGTADAGGYFPTASYITAGGATCASCHYHNNSVNAGWAEGGHGKLDAAAFVSNASHNWNGQGTDGVNYTQSPQKTNCIRCHSSRGFAQYWDSGFSNIDKVYLDPVAKTLDKASAPLTCDGCHSGSKGVRGAVRPMPAGFTKVKSFYGYSNTTYAPAKMVTNLEFTDNKNSNICLPCHSQRAAGTGIKALFAQGSFKQYSVGTSMYPHEAQPAAIVDGKGGYEFSGGSFAYQDRMRHIRIGNYGTGTGYNNTGITQGNCGGCHMTSTNTHSLETLSKDINGTFTGIVSNTCVKCHPAAFTYQDIQKKKAEFDAAVTVLGKLLVQKGFTQDGVTVIAERKSFDMSRNSSGVLTKDNAIAEKNVGAWFNWYLFNTADKAGYVHNPAYSRRLINDSIDWLDDNIINGSAAATIQTPPAGIVIDATTAANAQAQLNNPGCMGCHFGTGSTLNAEAVPGIEKAPHYNTNSAMVPGQTFTQAQFVVPGTQCNNCHGYGHGTDSPGGTIIKDYAESQHGSINGLAWTDYDFKTRQGCVQCHTTAGYVKNVGMVFTPGTAAPSLDAVGVATDTTKQVLGCNACHSSTAWKTSVRNSGSVVAPMGVTGNTPKAVITFTDVGESNACILCHASRENGESLVAGNPTNTTTKGFTNPHYLGAAAVFYGKGGFQFYTSGVRYNTYGAAGKVGKTANWSHGRLGMDNYSASGSNDLAGKSNDTGNKGQCIACHLGPKNTHTFGAAEVANETMAGSTSLSSGGLPLTRTCYGCHKGDATSPVATIAQFIDEEKEIWCRMFDFFKWQLAQYGINYTDAYPYFSGSFGATVGTTFGGVGVVDNNKTRGAAMNLKLLLAEKGSHVHNRAFGRALIADSMVYLQKGDVGNYKETATDPNQIIKFSDYSSARPTSYPGQVGPDISITTLKGYLTRTTNGVVTRR